MCPGRIESIKDSSVDVTQVTEVQKKKKKSLNMSLSSKKRKEVDSAEREGAVVERKQKRQRRANTSDIGATRVKKDPNKRKLRKGPNGQQLTSVTEHGHVDYLYGNYANYYKRRFRISDRIKVLDASLFSGKSVLDLGSNSGEFTLELVTQFRPKRIFGIDIDPLLVAIARRYLAQRRTSLSAYSEPKTTPASSSSSSSSSSSFSDISMLEAFDGTSFSCKDLLTRECFIGLERVDTILALSVTKWLHVHGGDNAIRALFQKFREMLNDGGALVLEWQPWSSYTGGNAKRIPGFSAKAAALKLRPDKDFEPLLVALGFKRVGKRSPHPKARPIYIFQKQT
jgi:7SK snRNA methylphosphate capping enzyme